MKAIFKRNDFENIYLVVKKLCYDQIYIYKIKFQSKIDKDTFNDSLPQFKDSVIQKINV